MKNDYLDYMRATEEYKSSDSLMHYRTVGSKNGVSTTPGYKAVGEKAKGLLNAAGRYIYSTAKTVGDRLSGVKNDYDLARKKTLSTGKNVITTTKYKGQYVRDDVLPIRKEVDAHEQRRTGYNNANVNKSIQNINAEKARVAAAVKKSASGTVAGAKYAVEAKKADERHAAALKKSLALAKAHDAELSTAQQKAADERHESALKKSLALAKEKEKNPYKEAVVNAGSELIDRADAIVNVAVKEDPEIESKVNQALIKAYKKYGVSESDFNRYGLTDANKKILVKELENCTSASEVVDVYERLCDKMAKEALLKKNWNK